MQVSRNIFLFLLLLLVSCRHSDKNNNSGNAEPHTIEAEKNGIPKIEFLTEMHNFGTLKAGETVAFSFVFINKGKMPVKIRSAESSCDCISVRFDDSEIDSGEKSAVEVTVKTSGEWGNMLKSVVVETSAGQKETLTVGAYIENEQFNNLLK